MALKDFFTLTELKNGLTSPNRVKELITVMQKEKDCVFKNAGDASRQWSTVANVIAITESKDCLDLFVQSDGLQFIGTWLNDAQKFGTDSGNIFAEESTTALLRALDRLLMDNCRLVSSGIRTTVLSLLGHDNSVVHDKAKALWDRWMNVQDTEAPHDVETNPSMAISISSSCRNGNVEKDTEDSVDDMKPLVCSYTVQHLDKEENTTTDKTMNPATTKQEPLDPGTTTLTGTSGSPPTLQSDVSQLDKCSVDAKEIHEIDALGKAGGMETSTPDINSVMESAIKTDLREDTSDKDEDVADSCAGALQGTPGPKIYSSTETDGGAADIAKKLVGPQSEDDSVIGSHLSKPSIKAQGGGVIGKAADMEPNCGMVDPLEVARQVAMEVEREVDSRELSCSTLEKMSGGGLEGRKSSDSKNKKESESIEGSAKLVSSGPGPSPKATHDGAVHVNEAETLGSDHKRDITTSQVSEVAQESEANTERGFFGFDLNQEVCSEEIDHLMGSGLTPIFSISVPQAAVADMSPVAALQFGGTHGWKGSAATRALQRIPECSFSGTTSNSKQRSDCLDIDLNVAEDDDDKIEDHSSQNKNLNHLIIYGLPSGEESSVEASTSRSARLHLDLNSLGDGSVDNVVPDWIEGRVASLNQNGCRSPSQSSSSSSKQPSMRNVDLNLSDQSVFPEDASPDHQNLGKLLNYSTASQGVHNRVEPVFSLFGTQVQVKQQDVVPPYGRILEPAIELDLGRGKSVWGLGSSMGMYGYNGFPSGPSMNFPSPYVPLGAGAPIPYMVDPRGVPVSPQIAQPPAFSQQPHPLIMNMGAGPNKSGHNLNLNPGYMINGGSIGGLRQLLNDNQGSWVNGRHLMQQASSSSVVGVKRQEPDSGWDAFPGNYKHQTNPWK